MNFKMLALVVASLSCFAGCNSRVDDCNKVIAVHNSGVEESKKLDESKPEGLAALVALNDKKSAEMAALPIKDEGVKTKTAAMIEANKKVSAEIKNTLTQVKEMETLAAKPMPSDVDAIKKHTDDLTALTTKMTTQKTTMEAAGAAEKKASDDFDAYCK